MKRKLLGLAIIVLVLSMLSLGVSWAARRLGAAAHGSDALTINLTTVLLPTMT